ncbi:MAG TPA: dephospho-CoA kinase [Caldithrix abyssi]|uniref:Dephospho-CoA kinase n=1 Tax=Caldithrix abyssi TaxID=187145 RepID=A0A7V4WVS0_CALAY|nr:dephospho-CoA kinase [Caldithrix abyssi]
MRKYKNPLVVAVTGGIGSGQSTVCSFFEQWRCKVINADQKAKEVIRKDRRLQKELKQVFGEDIFFKNRELNAKRLAELAFKDEIQTLKLNQLVHPRMVESLVEEMERARFSQKFPIIIIDAALVYEISIEQMFDYIIVVNAPMSLRSKRVTSRDGMTKKQFSERASKQIPLQDKVKWADFVIENDGTLEELKERTRQVYETLIDLQRKQERKR